MAAAVHSSLFRDFLLVTTFWFALFWLQFGFSSPAENLMVAEQVFLFLADYDKFGLIPPVPAGEGLLSAPALQWFVFSYWSIPSLSVALGLASIGALATYGLLRKQVMDRAARERAAGGFAGISITRGLLPLPTQLPRKPVRLDLGIGMPAHYQQLLNEVMGTLSAHPGAFVGDGHGVDLATHTLNVVEAMLDTGCTDPLTIVCAAAHDLGKITSYEKDPDGNWRRVKLHDKESARLIASLPSYYQLSGLEQQALSLALAFGHDVDGMPDGEGRELARQLLFRAKKADSAATKQEKERVLEALPLPEMVLRAFLEVLPVVPMQSPGAPKKIPAAGWRTGNRAWFLEWRIREEAMRRLPPDVKAAMGGDWRDKHRPAPYMIELLKVLAQHGWLVCKYEQWVCAPEHALWRIRAGIKEFNGVFAVDLPVEHLMKLPDETAYTLEVLGPQMALQGGTPVSDFGEVGLFKTPQKAKATPSVSAEDQGTAVPGVEPGLAEAAPAEVEAPLSPLTAEQTSSAPWADAEDTSHEAAAPVSAAEAEIRSTAGGDVLLSATEGNPLEHAVPDAENYGLVSHTLDDVKEKDKPGSMPASKPAPSKKTPATLPEGWPAVPGPSGKTGKKSAKKSSGNKNKEGMDPVSMGLLR